MKNRKKIIFLAPIIKGGPYFVYKEIVDGLIKKYSNEFKIIFVNSKINYLKLQFGFFGRIDVLFSVIPFVFRPIGVKKYIFNPRGNWQLEKKKNNLGNKLLYFADRNLVFADNIWLVSYFLADKLNFRKKFNKKIEIISNFVDSSEYSYFNKKYSDKEFKILTITSFKFYNKGKGILNLAKVISKLGENTNKKIIWTIVGNNNSINFLNIKKEFDNIKFNSNIEINWRGWCNKDDIKNELKNNDYFIYWTFLDNFPGVLLEAIVAKLKILVNNFESFKYFLDKKNICEYEGEMVEKILEDNIFLQDIGDFEKKFVLEKIYKLIK